MHLRNLLIGCALAPVLLHAQGYFQQRVDYSINVILDDVKHELNAQESFVYTNNSPQALDTIWIHLWPNGYKDRNTALCRSHDKGNDFDLHFAEEKDRGWIDSLDFRSGGAKLVWGVDPLNIDIGWIKLPLPLASGASITISTPFRVKIPSARFSRLGHIGQAYYITQWYPKPAVFDRHGWHPIPYLSQGEFYSEFGSFDVSITLPENYVVGATGELQNAEERARLDDRAAKPPPDGKDMTFPPSAPMTKTLRYVQDNVHDFAWIADKRFIVRKGEVTLPKSGRTVTTWAMYTPKNAPEWSGGVDYVGQALLSYSKWVGEYPYSACTAVDGTIAAGGGMEYPMITIIGEDDDPMALDEVIAHEVGHNWFYGMLGSNERDHPWMDEGVNSFCELRYMNERYPGKMSTEAAGIPKAAFGDRIIGHHDFSELAYRLNARKNMDQAPGLHSSCFTPQNYGTDVYMKTSLALDQLFAYLGEERFDACMHAYFDRWHHKHPYPEDMKAVFEEVSGKDLDWCFDALINDDRKVDIKALRFKNGTLRLKLDGPDRFPVPVTAYRGTDSLGTVWDSAEGGISYLTAGLEQADRVRIDAGERTLDIDRRNNEVRSSGLLRRGARPKLRFLTGAERAEERTTFWTPAVGYNAHDGFMAGIALHNYHFPSQRFEYALLPLYGTGSARPVGGARVEYHFDRLRSGPFRNVLLRGAFQSFSAYNQNDIIGEYEKWAPQVRFDLRRDLSLSTGHSVALRGILINERVLGEFEGQRISNSEAYNYEELRYDIERRAGLNPFTLNLTALNGDAFTRMSVEGDWSQIYDTHKHRISLRLFAGSFLRTDDAKMEARMGWRYHLGASDLLYDHLFINRQGIGEITDQQMSKDQGGFKTPNSFGTSDTWMAAMNLELDAPFRLPLVFFASAGAAPVTTVSGSGRSTRTEFQYEGGIGLRVIRDAVEVWVPLFASPDINDQLELRDFDFMERIRIVFALERMDPTRALRNLAP